MSVPVSQGPGARASQPVATAVVPQVALQSYLDALLQEATREPSPVAPAPAPEPPVVAPDVDEFEAAVREEQRLDAERQAAAALRAASAPASSSVPAAEVPPAAAPRAPVAVIAPPALSLAPASTIVTPPVLDVAEPDVAVAPVEAPPPREFQGRPEWAAGPFECLLFDVAGLTLAVPLASLGTIHSLAGRELTSLFGQPDWFLGLLPATEGSADGNLKVVDTARWVMPERYRDDYRDGLKFVISMVGQEWGLAVHQVSHSIRLHPDEVKWRDQRSLRPWLAGTVIEHMCALLDVEALAALIAASRKHPA